VGVGVGEGRVGVHGQHSMCLCAPHACHHGNQAVQVGAMECH
jgi:hypothetical protein